MTARWTAHHEQIVVDAIVDANGCEELDRAARSVLAALADRGLFVTTPHQPKENAMPADLNPHTPTAEQHVRLAIATTLIAAHHEWSAADVAAATQTISDAVLSEATSGSTEASTG